MNEFTLHDVVQVIDNEILWCIDNPDEVLQPEFQNGFKSGLLHAKYLIGEILSLDLATARKLDDIGQGRAVDSVNENLD